MNMIDEVRIEEERKQFKALGIVEGKRFEVEELTGYYFIDIVNRSCYAIDHRYARGLYGYNHSQYPIKGMYEHLLDGTWHVLGEQIETVPIENEDVEKFRELGIEDGKPFELVELDGCWIINIEKRIAWYYACESMMLKNIHRDVVKGAYDNIKNGVWHKK